MTSEELRKDLIERKEKIELQYVISLYKNQELYHEYKIEPKYIHNFYWKIYYAILEKMIEEKQIKQIDALNTDLFVSGQTEKLREAYRVAGGFDTVQEAIEIIDEKNIQMYYSEILRLSAIIKLIDSGFNVHEEWDNIANMNYEDLATYYVGTVDEIFSTIDMGEEKAIDIKDGLWEMIENADKGVGRGLPIHSRLLNNIINGQALGNITMLAGSSGTGKTFITINQVLPIVIEEEEPLLIMCNEEDVTRFQIEIITWYINNILGRDFIKSRFYQGNFSNEEWEILKIAKEWLDENLEDGLIKFVNFSTYSMDKAIRLIRKSAKLEGRKYFIIDTLKLDNDVNSKVSEHSWLQLQQNMVKLYNVIKPSENNLHVWVTYQLNKSADRSKYLDQSQLGISRNVADVVSTLILVRDVFEKEKGENGIVVKNQNETFNLDENKEYMIAFVDKNRRGSTAEQIVWEVDKGKSIIKDEGYTRIVEDFF